MKLASIYVGIALGAMALAGAGCSGGPECGEGTIEVDEACLPAEDVCGAGSVYDPQTGQCQATTACAAGTEYKDGECVPDGTVVCETGTTFDPDTGTCVADISGCAEGTVQVGDECVPRDDTLVADVEEPAEPNDAGDYGTVPVPNQDGMVTVSGCVEPYDQDGDGEPDVDLDGFRMSVTEPMLLRVTVDGLDGLAGGFLLQSEVTDLQIDGWRRLGLNMVGDTSQRQVYLPAAGDYVFYFSDSRSLLFGTPAGGNDTCYFATIEHLAMPTPEPITSEATGTIDGETRFFVYDAVADGEIASATVTFDREAALESVVTSVDGEYRRSGEEFTILWFVIPAVADAGGLRTDDQALIVVEPVYDYSLDPVSFLLEVESTQPAALPADGSTVAVSDEDFTKLWLSGNAGDVVNLDLSLDQSANVELYDRNLRYVTTLCSDCTAVDGALVQLVEDDIHYIELSNPDDEDPVAEIGVTATWGAETPAPLALGDSLEGVMLEGDGNDFYEITLADLTWVVLSGAGTDMNLEVRVYPRGVAGALDGDIAAEFVLPFGAGLAIPSILDWPAGVAEMTFLVRAFDATDDGVVAGESYDVAVLEREHTLVDLTAADSFTETATPLAADGANHYLVLVDEARLVAELSNVVDADVAIELLDVAEAPTLTVNDAGAGAGETWADFTGDAGWVALRITEQGAASGSYDLSLALDAIDEMANATVNMGIPDAAPLEVTLNVANACTVAAVTVDIASDVEAAGTTIELSAPGGAAVVLSDGSLPSVALDGNFPLDFEPTGSLDDFAGVEAMGDWTLSLTRAGGSAGTVTSADLNFYCAN